MHAPRACQTSRYLFVLIRQQNSANLNVAILNSLTDALRLPWHALTVKHVRPLQVDPATLAVLADPITLKKSNTGRCWHQTADR